MQRNFRIVATFENVCPDRTPSLCNRAQALSYHDSFLFPSLRLYIIVSVFTPNMTIAIADIAAGALLVSQLCDWIIFADTLRYPEFFETVKS